VAKVTVLALSYGAYAAVVLHTYQYLGRVLGMLTMVPIVLGGHYFGIIGGVAAGFLGFPVSTAVLWHLGADDLFAASRLITWLVMVVFGLVSGIIKKVSERRRRSEELLNVAFEAAQDGLWDYHLDTQKVYFSPRWFTMLGYQPNEFAHTYDNWVRLLHPDDREQAVRKVEEAAESGCKQFSLDFRLREKSGAWRWILARGKVVEFDENGRATRLVGVHSDVSELKKAEADLVYLAYHDQLTGLLNRKAFYERAEETLNQAQRSDAEQLRAFLLIDLDNFKDVNDSFGHDFGDALLKEAAARLRSNIRRSDLLFRLGGDEFTIILAKLHEPTDAALVASNLIRAFSAPFTVAKHTVYTGISIGIAVYPRDGEDAAELIRNADAALYSSKRDRNTYRFYTLRMQAEALDKMRIINNLRAAIEGEQFRVHYQPIVDARGVPMGAEALLRWEDPEEGLKLPGQFIGVAEETGLILPIGRWVLQQATKDAASWRRSGLGDLRVSVNLSPRQLRFRSILRDIETALSESGLPPELLDLELTEGSFVDTSDESIDRLREFRSRGIRLAIDDFGTGYSSLSYLKRLPVDTIKIDRSFVIGLPLNLKDVSIVQSVTTMAHGLGLSVVAEGVDSTEQVDFLAKLGCDSFQGYYYAKPMPPAQFEAFARGERTEYTGPGALVPSKLGSGGDLRS